MFTILDISHGWIDFKFSNHDYELVSSWFLNYDFPKELLSTLYSLINEKSKNKYISAQGEPGADIIKLSLSGSRLIINVYGAINSSDDLIVNQLDKEPLDEHILYAEYDVLDFSKSVVGEIERWLEKLGLEGYQKHWGEYPLELIQKLSAIL